MKEFPSYEELKHHFEFRSEAEIIELANRVHQAAEAVFEARGKKLMVTGNDSAPAIADPADVDPALLAQAAEALAEIVADEGLKSGAATSGESEESGIASDPGSGNSTSSPESDTADESSVEAGADSAPVGD